MQTVNFAHGAMYLLGAYIGYDVFYATGNWYLGIAVAAIIMAAAGAIVRVAFLGRLQGQDLRQGLTAFGLSIVMADLMLAHWGGQFYQNEGPDWMFACLPLPIIKCYPINRLILLVIAAILGLGLWFLLKKTKLGIIIRAGVDDRDMVAALGVNVSLIAGIVFALGTGLAGFAGAIGGTVFNAAPGEDMRFMLSSLVVVIVGGMGSVAGAAIGALLIGLAEQYGLYYVPSYGIVFVYMIMTAVLALRPQGIMGRAA